MTLRTLALGLLLISLGIGTAQAEELREGVYQLPNRRLTIRRAEGGGFSVETKQGGATRTGTGRLENGALKVDFEGSASYSIGNRVQFVVEGEQEKDVKIRPFQIPVAELQGASRSALPQSPGEPVAAPLSEQAPVPVPVEGGAQKRDRFDPDAARQAEAELETPASPSPIPGLLAGFAASIAAISVLGVGGQGAALVIRGPSPVQRSQDAARAELEALFGNPRPAPPEPLTKPTTDGFFDSWFRSFDNRGAAIRDTVPGALSVNLYRGVANWIDGGNRPDATGGYNNTPVLDEEGRASDIEWENLLVGTSPSAGTVELTYAAQKGLWATLKGAGAAYHFVAGGFAARFGDGGDAHFRAAEQLGRDAKNKYRDAWNLGRTNEMDRVAIDNAIRRLRDPYHSLNSLEGRVGTHANDQRGRP